MDISILKMIAIVATMIVVAYGAIDALSGIIFGTSKIRIKVKPTGVDNTHLRNTMYSVYFRYPWCPFWLRLERNVAWWTAIYAVKALRKNYPKAIPIGDLAIDQFKFQ